MKKIVYLTLSVLLLSSCESFLDTESYTKKNTSNFPATVTDAEQMITSVYNALNLAIATPLTTYFCAGELASDERFGGGGENDKEMQAVDKLMNVGANWMEPYWTAYYKGIFRANTAIETLDNCTGWESESQRNQLMGEALFLRAYYYNELAQMFGQVPLVVKTEPLNLPKATADEIYAQIATDLKTAIDIMPANKYNQVVSGHATKWAAEALMARTFLFYTGFYSKDALPLLGEDGTVSGSVTKDQVVAWLDDCIANSGHDLVGDYRNLWTYTNQYTKEEYPFTKGKGLNWEVDGNKETVFAVKFSSFSSWSTTIGYNNQYNLYFGIRGGQDYEKTFPFGQGWGAGPVNPTLWKEWKQAEPTDIRREASIIDIPNELPNYTYGGWADFMEETDYWQKKYVPVTARKTSDGKLAATFEFLMYGLADDNMQLNNLRDLVTIRFADVLLMHSELSQTATGINRVRARVNLPPVTYSLDALKRERRFELSFEGVRWNDIRRWGDAPELLAKQEGVAIYLRGNASSMKAFGGGYKARYEATKGGFFPIPQSQIALSEGVLEQNPGWGTTEAEYQGW